jgi:PAS domain S-box-containing protein
VGVLAAVLAAAIRVQFLEVLELRAAFLTFYPAVAIAALYGGFGAGLLATVVSAALADYFWMEPVRQFAIMNSADLISIIVFLASGALIASLAEAAYQAQARAHKAEEQSRLAAERKQAEALLQRQAELLHLSYDAIIVWQLGGCIESWNKGAEELYGYSQEEAVGQVTHDLLKTIHSVPWPQIEATLRDRKFWEGELKHRTSEGREVIVSARHQLVRGAEGVERVMETNRDITEQKRAEASLTADLAALTRMHALSGRLLETGGTQPLLQEIMDAAVSIVGAEMGTLQLLERDSLWIVADHGHRQPFLQFFASAENQASVCGEATRRGERVVVSDVETSSLFTGTPSLAVLKEAGVRAVQSTPVMSRNGALLGILTTQWGVPYTPDEHDLWRIDLLARQAADLIEHSQAAEELRKSEERFRTMANAIPQLAWIAEADGYIFWYNQRWYDYTGTTPEQMKGWGWQSVHDPEALPEVLEQWRVSIATGRPFDMVFPLRSADGSFREFLTRVMPMMDSAGQIVQWFGTNTDYTERKQAEEMLRESEAKLQAALASIPDAVFISDAEGRLVNFNDAFGIYHRFRSEDECSRSIADCPTYLDAYMADGHPAPPEMWAIPRALRGERVANTEYTLRRKDTGESWVGSYSFSPIRDKDDVIIGSVVVARDITEQQQMKEALRKSRDELELRVRERTAELSTAGDNLRKQAALLDLAHDAILVRDMDNKILYWNDGAEKTYGWAKEEALGKAAHTLLHTHFPKPMDELTADLLKAGQWEGELRHKTKGGDQIVVASRWAIQKDADGNPTGMLEINRDITARKKAEEQLDSYMAKIEESNQALQDFAYIAAHDMKEPLRKVIAFGNMLRQKSGDLLGESGNDYLHRMLNATARMQSLLAGLLDYSRVAAAAEPFKEINLSNLIGEVLSDLEVRIVKTGGEVHVGDLPVISADPTQMRQLFQNLIGNALKFHKAGEKPMIQVRSVSDTDSGCRIAVEDNGIGFEGQYLEKIFTPFQRLHGRSEYEGTGMGLAICKKIVERHGGSITARSEPGKGSTFLIMLPQGPTVVQRV